MNAVQGNKYQNYQHNFWATVSSDFRAESAAAGNTAPVAEKSNNFLWVLPHQLQSTLGKGILNLSSISPLVFFSIVYSQQNTIIH